MPLIDGPGDEQDVCLRQRSAALTACMGAGLGRKPVRPRYILKAREARSFREGQKLESGRRIRVELYDLSFQIFRAWRLCGTLDCKGSFGGRVTDRIEAEISLNPSTICEHDRTP